MLGPTRICVEPGTLGLAYQTSDPVAQKLNAATVVFDAVFPKRMNPSVHLRSAAGRYHKRPTSLPPACIFMLMHFCKDVCLRKTDPDSLHIRFQLTQHLVGAGVRTAEMSAPTSRATELEWSSICEMA